MFLSNIINAGRVEQGSQNFYSILNDQMWHAHGQNSLNTFNINDCVTQSAKVQATRFSFGLKKSKIDLLSYNTVLGAFF